MKKIAVALAFGLVLAGCMGPYEFRDLDAARITPTSPVEKKIPGRYAVAIVGNLGEPVVGRTTWTRQYGPQMWGADLTFHVGDPLTKAVTAAVNRSFAEPVFVPSEEAARASARSGGGAVIVRYKGGETGGDSSQNFWGYFTRIHVVLEGEMTLLPPGGAETVRPIYGRGGDAKQGAAFTWSEIVPPVAEEAAEQAIAAFADRVTSLLVETYGR